MMGLFGCFKVFRRQPARLPIVIGYPDFDATRTDGYIKALEKFNEWREKNCEGATPINEQQEEENHLEFSVDLKKGEVAVKRMPCKEKTDARFSLEAGPTYLTLVNKYGDVVEYALPMLEAGKAKQPSISEELLAIPSPKNHKESFNVHLDKYDRIIDENFKFVTENNKDDLDELEKSIRKELNNERKIINEINGSQNWKSLSAILNNINTNLAADISQCFKEYEYDALGTDFQKRIVEDLEDLIEIPARKFEVEVKSVETPKVIKKQIRRKDRKEKQINHSYVERYENSWHKEESICEKSSANLDDTETEWISVQEAIKRYESISKSMIESSNTFNKSHMNTTEKSINLSRIPNAGWRT